MHSEV
jgi:hypothetical protein